MQTTDNIDFIESGRNAEDSSAGRRPSGGVASLDYDKYDESDLDYTRGNKKHSYYTITKYYHYSYWDGAHAAWLSTTLECTYRITHGTFSPTEDSDRDYLGFTDLVSWDVLSVENNEGDEVDPEKVLTEGQFLEYIEGLDQFIGD